MTRIASFAADSVPLVDRLEQLAEQRLRGLMTDRDVDLFCIRFRRHFQDLFDGASSVYGRQPEFAEFLERLTLLMAGAYAERSDELRRLDLERAFTPDWFQQPSTVGYVFYANRFAGTLSDVGEHLGYLEELGITYVHIMPLLKPREGENDGGYAVADYRSVAPQLGNMTDLEVLARQMRGRNMSLCIDLVFNHVAREHEWAQRAQAGEKKYQEYFRLFADRTLPDEYEKTLLEIFPAFAPGNFTFDPQLGQWVWTTFHNFQWDLNWSNPNIFLEFADLLFFLANKGVEIFRLDAVAFIWKRLGTNSQNQPEVHAIVQALRAASRIVTPAVVFKAEAIVAPKDLIHYLGSGRRHGKVSDLAYHNVLMVQLWSSLASRDTRLISQTLRTFPEKPTTTAWSTYVRCHDDIGWAVSDEDAANVGLDGFAHRRFLSEFYVGKFPGSHARGLIFQQNPRTGDCRISGSTASLAGLELGLSSGNELLVTLSIERILLTYAVIFAFSGVPLIYMGDELAMINDYSYRDNPTEASDSRWVNRPRMDWRKAVQRTAKNTPEGRVFRGLRALISARTRTPQLHAAVPVRVVETNNTALFAYARPHPVGTLLAVYNFSERPQSFAADVAKAYDINNPVDQIALRWVDVREGRIHLAPYGRLWLVEAPSFVLWFLAFNP